MAEQLRLEQRLGNRRAVHLDERHGALRAAIVDRAGDELLAGAGLAEDQDRALGFGHQLGAPDHLFHRPAAADDAVVVELLVALAEQVAVLGAQPLMVERAPDDHQQLVDLERLLQVVERAELHRLDRALDGRVRRHHQNLRPLAFRRRADVLADQIEAAHLRHHVVDDEDVEAALREQPLRLPRARRLDDVVAVVAQRAAERLQDLFFVVDEQNGAATVRHHDAPCATLAGVSRAELGAPSRRRRGERQVDPDLGAAARLARHGNRAAKSLDDVLGDGEAEPGAAALGGEVRVEDAPEIGRVDADAAILDDDRDAIAAPPRCAAMIERGSAAGRATRAGPDGVCGRSMTAASAHRMAGVDQHVDERDAQPFGVGRDRRQRRCSQSRWIGAPGPGRLRGGRRLAAERVEVRRRQLEPNRPREIEHLVHDPVQPRDFVVDVGDRLAQRDGGRRRADAARAATP